MSEVEATFREAGMLRDAAPFASCATDPCDSDARVEVLHSPADEPTAIFVPLCDWHWDATCRGERIEYVVECHGFVGGGR